MGEQPPAIPEAPPATAEQSSVQAAPAAQKRRTAWVYIVDLLKNEDSEHYDKTFPFTVLAPAIWLAIVWALMLAMLFAVGYMSGDKPATGYADLVNDLNGVQLDIAARRAALAFSGVTLAITMALSLTSLFWCGGAWANKSGAFRSCILACVGAFLVASLRISWNAATHWKPFTSELGQELLKRGSAQLDAPLAQDVPLMMFILSCVVPSILLAGATFLLQPMGDPESAGALKDQVRTILKRLRELDQMLYIGALALVFGTLQLSSGLSVGLVSMPKAADLKVRADLCKAMAPAPTASSPFFAKPEPEPSTVKGSKGAPPHKVAPASTVIARAAAPAASTPADSPFDSQCQKLPGLLLKLDSAESLRQLVHGITVCFGLAFSALLAAIYVPSLIVLRNLLEPRQEALEEEAAKGSGEKDSAVAAVDPFSRVAAVVATLSPLFAGLLANMLAGG